MEENDVVKILELDKISRKKLSEAEEKRDRIDADIPAQVSALHDEYYDRMNKELQAFEKERTDSANKRIEAQDAQYQKQLDAIDAKYKSDRKKWLDHIVGAVTEV